MARAADVDADAYRLWVHLWLLTRLCDEEISSARRVYIQSHDLTIGTIPAGVTDDVDDGGGISESSDVCRQTTDPMSHTPVSRKCYASRRRVSSTNSMVDPSARSNDPSSATRRTGRVDCYRDARAGFAAAHGSAIILDRYRPHMSDLCPAQHPINILAGHVVIRIIRTSAPA